MWERERGVKISEKIVDIISGSSLTKHCGVNLDR